MSLGCHGGEAAVADMDHMCLTWVCVRASGSTSAGVSEYSHTDCEEAARWMSSSNLSPEPYFPLKGPQIRVSDGLAPGMAKAL